MAFDPRHDFKESAGSDRPERKNPCSKCRTGITLLAPVPGVCWACWAGWPMITRPVRNLQKTAEYRKAVARIEQGYARREAKKVVEEVFV